MPIISWTYPCATCRVRPIVPISCKFKFGTLISWLSRNSQSSGGTLGSVDRALQLGLDGPEPFVLWGRVASVVPGIKQRQRTLMRNDKNPSLCAKYYQECLSFLPPFLFQLYMFCLVELQGLGRNTGFYCLFNSQCCIKLTLCCLRMKL